jgi:dihydroflavonol-4-reductase
VNAELEDGASIFAAIKGCEYVVHTASPFPLVPPKDHSQVISPAVRGTAAVLDACYAHKIKRLVLTSSTRNITDVLI